MVIAPNTRQIHALYNNSNFKFVKTNVIWWKYNKKFGYKTWSSVSNSSISKTFALGSLESIKFRSSISSLQRSFSLRLILGQKQFWVWKKFWVRNFFLDLTNFRLTKFFGLQKCLVPKKCCVPKKNFVQKCLIQKKIWVQKILGTKIFGKKNWL